MRTVVTIAGLVVIAAAIKIAAPIIVPILLAATFAIAFQPVTELLRKRGVPTFVAAVLTVLFVLLALGGIGTLATIAVTNLAADAPRYAEQLKGVWQSALAQLNDVGLGAVASGMATTDLGGRAGQYVQAAALWMSGAAGDLLNVLLLTVFIQLEASMLRRKLSIVSRKSGLTNATKAFAGIQQYLRVKFMLALINGIVLGGWCALWGVSNPILWGVAAFTLNFVPIIGSLISAVPPILLALIEHGIGTSIGVAAGYIAVNIAVDNMLEPRLMGRTLDISPLVLLLSLLLWGFLLGPIGALLSFPLTVSVRIYCEHHPSTRWIAVFLAAKTDQYELEEAVEEHQAVEHDHADKPSNPEVSP